MCRHLAYLGPPIRLGELLLDPPHALAHQSWAPRDMRGGGTINVDGFGVGWYPGPLRYRRDRPIWSDLDLPALAAAVEAPAMLAAVRSASPGMPPDEAACAPFCAAGWLFSLNGRVEGWPSTMAALASQLPAADLLALEAMVDSALLWALVRHRMRRGASPPEAVSSVVADVAAAAPGSRLNLLLADSRTIVATAVGHSLWVRVERAGEVGGEASVLVSSEPLDEHPAWRPLPDGTLLVATPSSVETSALPVNGDHR